MLLGYDEEKLKELCHGKRDKPITQDMKKVFSYTIKTEGRYSFFRPIIKHGKYKSHNDRIRHICLNGKLWAILPNDIKMEGLDYSFSLKNNFFVAD